MMYKCEKKKILIKIGLILSICGQALFSLNNNTSAYASEYQSIIDTVTEENYSETMKYIVEPFVNDKMQAGYIKDQNGLSLYYEKYKVFNAKANIVISHGFTENLEKYHEVIYYFLKEGYNVFAMEHRGHGRSGNLSFEDKSQMSVESFDYYIQDFKRFVDDIVIPNNEGKKMFLFAHSMGGGIGTGFLEQYPSYFDAAVLSSPMLEVNTGSVPTGIAEIIAKFAVFANLGEKYVMGQSKYSNSTMEQANTTTCLSRYEYYRDYVRKDEAFQKGGASFQWLNEALQKTKSLRKQENAEKVKIPVLLFQAGDDAYVRPGGQNQFAKYAANCTIEKVENSKHEMFLEIDEIQKPYFEKLLKFYKDNL